MRRFVLAIALLALAGLALATTAMNVAARAKSYQIGAQLREMQDLRLSLTYTSAHARRLASTDRLLTAADALRVDPAEMFPIAAPPFDRDWVATNATGSQ